MTCSRTIDHGDRNEFAVIIEFEVDPDGGAGASLEYAVSWGRLELWVRGKNLCRHYEEDVVEPSVRWYLFPVIEWIVHNWDALLHEQKLPLREVHNDAWEALDKLWSRVWDKDDEVGETERDLWYEWRGRHSLQTARDGGLFPDIVIRRWQNDIEISWGPTAIPGFPDSYPFVCARGSCAGLDPINVAAILYNVAHDAINYLSQQLPDSSEVKELLNGFKSIPQTRDEPRLALMAGLGTTVSSAVEKWREVARRVPEMFKEDLALIPSGSEDKLVVTGSCEAPLMFGSLSPNLTEDDTVSIARALVTLSSTDPEDDSFWGEVTEDPPIDEDDAPYQQGYDLAEWFMSITESDIGREEWVDLDSLIRERLRIIVQEIPFSDDTIRGLAVGGPNHSPAMILNTRHRPNTTEAGRRFTMAHELCHLLVDRDRGRQLAMASGPWIPESIEQRANAFAAMFLMPRALVEKSIQSLKSRLDSEQAILDVRSTFKTGFDATLEHLTNLGYLDETDKRKIRSERESRMESH
jgi:Zn-dependent peptidase ImmA (M78 family)